MTSLLALLSQQTPSLQTRKGLILLGLQNDFVSADGKLPVPLDTGFLDRIEDLVPSFRTHGDVIWVRSEFEANRELHAADESGDTVIAGSYASINDSSSTKPGSKRSASEHDEAPLKRMKATDAEYDAELFLTRTTTREPCCIRDSWGADHPDNIKATMDNKRDLRVTKTYYSAFGSTSLLLTLRSKLITELFVCGCNTNLSVFATAMDAARYGIKITLVEDCLGYRQKARHDEAIRQLVDIMSADVITSDKVIDVLLNPPEVEEDEYDDEEDDDNVEEQLANEPGRWTDYRATEESAANVAPAQLELGGSLAADSDDDDEEEMALPQVRSSLLSSSRLPLRYASALTTRSRPAAFHPERPSQHAQPSDTQPAITGSNNGSANGLVTERANFESVRLDCTGGVEPAVELSSYGGVDGDYPNAVPEGPNAVIAVEPPLDALHANTDVEATTQVASNVCNSLLVHESDKPQETIPSSTRTEHERIATSLQAERPPADKYVTSAMKQARRLKDSTITQPDNAKSQPLLGVGKERESVGSQILYDLLPPDLADDIFEELNSEVGWQRMHHQTGEVPRLVCCQGTTAPDGTKPVYRHPSDETLPLHTWTPSVEKVRVAAEEAVGHPLNHALIQLYRGGTDYISEHSDKTLDIMRGSSIVNVSFGAQRTMRLRTKRGAAVTASSATSEETSTPVTRTTYRIAMPHNSIITMSLPTNAEYLHGINADKRPAVEYTEAEKAYDGQRISLTFRNIATFLTTDDKKIWGQGATGKTAEEAQDVISGDVTESEILVRAFGAENQASNIDWDAVYRKGSDVLHLK